MENEDIAYQAGDILVGKYRVDHVLGVGGFGAVLAATHIQLEEKVAIKILLPHAAKNPAASERFLREARAAVRIRSEHVARVTDVGQLPDTTPYMVMEYLAGQDLSAQVKAQGGQSVSDVAEWLLQACEALAEAHSLGIIHRDLKPANLFLTRKFDGSPCIKVLDFGISKMSNELGGDKGMTKTSDVMGSPFYMSPEQMRSTRSVDARSDIWALGAILFEMLAGAPPFDAETMTALVVSIMQEQPRDLGAYRRDVPPQMYEIIMCCLQKDPNKRYPDVASLAMALAPFAPQRSQQNLQRVMMIAGRQSVTSGVPSSGPTVVSSPGVAPTAPGVTGGVSHGGMTMEGAPASALFRPEHHSQPSPTVPGHISNGHISGGAISGSSVSDNRRPSHPRTQLDTSQPQLAIGYDSSSKLAATAASPAQSWGGTYMGSKKQSASKAPIVIGILSLIIAAGGAGGFFLFKQQGDSPKGDRKTGTVDASNANVPAPATPTATATVTADAKLTATAAPAPEPTVAPVQQPPRNNGKPSKTATATATATVTAPPTQTQPPYVPPPPNTTPPPPATSQKPKPPKDPLWDKPD